MCKEALTPILNEEYRRMFTALLLVGEEKKKKNYLNAHQWNLNYTMSNLWNIMNIERE